MANRYVQQAQRALAPGYGQKVQALQSQVPAIQQLYQTLIQGLQNSLPQQNLNVLEDASSRGILRSTIPVFGQQQVAQNLLQQQGQLGAQQGKELGDIFSQIAGVGIDQAKSTADLANAYQGNALQQQMFQNQVAQGNRQYALQKQTADQQYQLGLQAARRGY